ncbi:MAG TPA: hypothetical protein VFE18_16530 [Phenylobacterium sp.]|uniref:O-linked N-acetylglucosamine transferase, SPINDLY family protein n=1 Tax=Phenylobacterium sp. TaxID=1871053 RepID=UPI002D261D2B|nr:hypothetical protein [Phenylobacterium sp.]HZZ69780.1 hypothetical protein [Phenylobacterium sp.]
MTPPSTPDPLPCATRVAALLQAKAFPAAIAEAELGLQASPASAELWNLLAAARLLAGDLAQGHEAALRALALDPEVFGARENAAAALEGLRQPYREALAGLTEVQDEAARLEQAYRAVIEADEAGWLEDAAKGVSLGLFLRLTAIEEADRRWPFAEIGQDMAARGEHRNLLYQIPRVRSDADRRELLAQHRLWGQGAEAAAAAQPIGPAPRGPRDRPRVGLLSSDIRIHPVGPFVAPLVDHAAAAGVELFCYSAYPGEADGFQQHVAAQAAAFRHLPGAEPAELARAIASDALDVLIEIGGSTTTNRLETMAHRLAPVQVSWLGYPHSAGLGTIDYLVLDSRTAPTEPDLMIERPLLMPRTWVAISPGYFRDDIPLETTLPQDRAGHITFGTAGSPYKYSAAALEAWARVVAAVPGSRFRIVRPEGGSAIFRRNIAERFARHGVGAERLEFAAVRGGHLPHYNEIDVCLDTFPLTGGMTTCEALWMGAPVVSLAGKATYERLGHSLLNNAGLGDLSTASADAFVARAVALASDRERRRDWRAHGRERIMGGPLGDQEGFARDFFALVIGAL